MNNIICIGRNYTNHAKELGNNIPKEPIFFFKPFRSILIGNIFEIPKFSKEIHHEIELVLKISQDGKDISYEDAENYYEEIGLGIDFTARDIQTNCIEKSLPWEISKAFDNSAVLGNIFINKKNLDKKNITFELHKNEIIVQNGNSNNMIFDFEQIISYVSKFITLKKGDLIYTGTPEGVDKVMNKDMLTGYISDKKILEISVKDCA